MNKSISPIANVRAVDSIHCSLLIFARPSVSKAGRPRTDIVATGDICVLVFLSKSAILCNTEILGRLSTGDDHLLPSSRSPSDPTSSKRCDGPSASCISMHAYRMPDTCFTRVSRVFKYTNHKMLIFSRVRCRLSTKNELSRPLEAVMDPTCKLELS